MAKTAQRTPLYSSELVARAAVELLTRVLRRAQQAEAGAQHRAEAGWSLRHPEKHRAVADRVLKSLLPAVDVSSLRKFLACSSRLKLGQRRTAALVLVFHREGMRGGRPPAHRQSRPASGKTCGRRKTHRPSPRVATTAIRTTLVRFPVLPVNVGRPDRGQARERLRHCGGNPPDGTIAPHCP